MQHDPHDALPCASQVCDWSRPVVHASSDVLSTLPLSLPHDRIHLSHVLDMLNVLSDRTPEFILRCFRCYCDGTRGYQCNMGTDKDLNYWYIVGRTTARAFEKR